MNPNWEEYYEPNRPNLHCILDIETHKGWKIRQHRIMLNAMKARASNLTEYFTSKNRKKFDSLCKRFDYELKLIDDHFEDAKTDTKNYEPFVVNNQLIDVSKTIDEIDAVMQDVEKTYQYELAQAWAKKKDYGSTSHTYRE